MEKIEFKNNSEPYLSAENLNQMQENAEVYIDSNIEKIKQELEDYKKISYTLANTVRGENIIIENAVEYKLLNLEIDGKSEQETRFGKNLLNVPEKYTLIGSNLFNISLEIGTYTISAKSLETTATYVQLCFYFEDASIAGRYVSLSPTNLSINITFDYRVTSVRIYSADSYNTSLTTTTTYNKLMISKNGGEYEAYGVSPSPDYPSKIESVGRENVFNKYGVEIKTVGKNSINSITKVGNVLYFNEAREYTDYIFKAGTYTFSYENINATGLFFRDAIGNERNLGTNKTITFTSDENFNIWLYRSGMVEGEVSNVQLERGSIATEYQPYQSNTTLIVLDEPLRSLPNGTKDIAYIKNNKLYVERHIGSKNLNGTEDWNINSGVGFHSPVLQGIVRNLGKGISNRYVFNEQPWKENYTFSINSTGIIAISDNTYSTVNEFKNWLSNNNVQVDYELATPVTEEVGDCVINAFAGVNNIDLETNLETEFSVTYVQDIKILLENYPTNEEMKNYVDSILGTISS